MGLEIIATIALGGVAGSFGNLLSSYLKKKWQARAQQAEWDRAAAEDMVVHVHNADGSIASSGHVTFQAKKKPSRQVQLVYKDRDGEQTPLLLDPTDAENIHAFLKSIRQEEETVRGALRGPATPAG